MIHQIKPDFYIHIEELYKSEKIDTVGTIYDNISSPLIETLDMGATMVMRVHLEGMIDESTVMRDWITSRRMI